MNKPKPSRIFNKPESKQRRQALRQQMTEPEKCLWKILRKQQMGVKFRRQHGIGNYIVDFYCTELKLAIEVDGDSHYSENSQNHNDVRDRFLQSLGVATLRLRNDDVMKNIEGVHQHLMQKLASRRVGMREEFDNGES